MKKVIETIIFKYTPALLIPFYLVLILALAVYTYFDISAFIHYITHLNHIDKDMAMVTFVELIDMMMIANLGKQLVTGSYNSFVSKKHGYVGENISSGMLKVKMTTSLVGVTGIALLQRSIHIEEVSWDVLYKVAFVHCVFLLSSIILEVVDYMHEKSECLYHESHNEKTH